MQMLLVLWWVYIPAQQAGELQCSLSVAHLCDSVGAEPAPGERSVHYRSRLRKNFQVWILLKADEV